jgi:hypothetical protein
VSSCHVDVRTLAVGCLYLLTNRATLEFPGSSRSHPSGKVVVNITPGGFYRHGDRAYFPFWVYWGLWHEGVVPVLENKDVQVIVTDNPSLRVNVNLSYLQFGQVDVLINKIEWYLKKSLVETGWLPASCAGFEEVEEEILSTCPPAPAEKNWNPLGPTGPDVQNLFHPDGTPRLVYNVVDGG